MQTYFDGLPGKSSDQIFKMGRGEDADFPKDHMLFVQRDMFGDSCFAKVIIPATQEAFLAFFVHHYNSIHGERAPEYRLEVTEYHGDAIIVVYYDDPEKGHWVKGFLRYGVPQDMPLPFVVHVNQESLKLFEGWSLKTLRPRDPESRVEGDTLLWSKD